MTWPPDGVDWYYSDEYTAIACGDCREVLPRLPKVDLVLTDPPYNAPDIGPHHRKYANGQGALSPGKYKKFIRAWVKLMPDDWIVTPGIANTHLYPQPRWILAWHKPAAVSFNCFRGYNAWEPIFCYGKPLNKLGQDYLRFNTLNLKKGAERHHPCPKPLSLWGYLVSKMPKGIIVDPFMGSGTTLVAAKSLGRRAIGIEIERKYCDIAVKRLQQEYLPLFADPPRQDEPPELFPAEDTT
jgi:DNA modification methylase